MKSLLGATEVVIATLAPIVFLTGASATKLAPKNMETVGRFQIGTFPKRGEFYGGGYDVIDTATVEVWNGTGDKSRKSCQRF